MNRTKHLLSIQTALGRSPVTALLGPRQCGKTTLARELLPIGHGNYFDLEDPVSLARLEAPMSALSPLTGLVVIDEVQLRPDLFPVLRVLADRPGQPARFLVLGSAAPALLRQSSESLAGRMELIELRGFGLDEVGFEAQGRHLLRGGFPRAFLARTDADSFVWRRDFIRSFLERDLPALGAQAAPSALWRFWNMLAHYHGQTWNAAPSAASLGVSQPTVRHYLDLLTGSFLIRQLQPFHANIGKRQVKAPRIYFRDSGLLHHVLGVRTADDLLLNPRYGASFEGYVIEEVIAATEPDEAYFWSTHQGAEVDLVLAKNGKLYGVECKLNDAPKRTPSMRHAMADLGLAALAVVYPGTTRYALADGIEAVPMTEIVKGMAGLFPGG